MVKIECLYPGLCCFSTQTLLCNSRPQAVHADVLHCVLGVIQFNSRERSQHTLKCTISAH